MVIKIFRSRQSDHETLNIISEDDFILGPPLFYFGKLFASEWRASCSEFSWFHAADWWHFECIAAAADCVIMFADDSQKGAGEDCMGQAVAPAGSSAVPHHTTLVPSTLAHNVVSVGTGTGAAPCRVRW